MQIVQDEDYPDSVSDENQRKVWAWFAETEVKRCKLFDLPLPRDTVAMAKRLGVDLDKVGEPKPRLKDAPQETE